MSFVGSEFLVSHCRLHTTRHFYELSPLEMCLTTLTSLSLEEMSIPACYYPTQVFFTTLFNHATLFDVIQQYQAHPIKHQTQSSNSINAMSLYICNAMRHYMLYHATCIMNATWTTPTTPLTYFHGQSHHLHMTSIHHFIHVNISCTHIPTSTYNMSFYFQAMTHTKSNHVMTICTYKLITCQYIRTHILTSKHVTHSQAMTLSNKSYNGLEASRNSHKSG